MSFNTSLLPLALDKTVSITIRSGSVYTGTLIGCDTVMNLRLKDATRSVSLLDEVLAEDIPSVFIRGTSILSIVLPEGTVELAKERLESYKQNKTDTRRNANTDGDNNGSDPSRPNRNHQYNKDSHRGGRGGSRGGRGGHGGSGEDRGGRGGYQNHRGGRGGFNDNRGGRGGRGGQRGGHSSS